MLISIVIRTLNEARYLGDLLRAVSQQQLQGFSVQTVLVDSGSTDNTVEIALRHGCKITRIRKEDFSFGRSLNVGCQAADGEILVFISGHCVPVDEHWLQLLCQPIRDGVAHYTYGRQVGGPESRYSECRIFEKYYPQQSALPQAGYFTNNANSAVARAVWAQHGFDEELTGLEDMHLAKRMLQASGLVGYVAEAAVYHYHHETWAQVRRRFEREAMALQTIKPEVQLGLLDVLRYLPTSIAHDLRCAAQERRARSLWKEITLYRYHQYVGSWRGHHTHRKLSAAEKEAYFYPVPQQQARPLHDPDPQAPHRRPAAHEGQQ
jgi:rhamnosyltransferase